MLTFLSKIFIRDRENVTDPKVRTAYGTLCSIYGIFLNVLLFIGKFIAGSIAGSIAITADSFNNLADAGSSIITLFGFRLANQKPDPNHPFGHGRFEYISGLIVSFAIILMGVELGKGAVSSIINPEKVEYTTLSLVIIAVSILVKLYMAFYNRSIGKKISSAAMSATMADSLSDAVSTGVVLLIALISPFIPFAIDGWAGLVVSAFILITGIKSARETISPLLGQPPENSFVSDIETIVMAHDEISGIHDLVVHDYGPGRLMISLHAEIPVTMDVKSAHDVIDNIEFELADKLNCHATIHMDPINVEDEYTNMMRNKVSDIVSSIAEGASVHDFRLVSGQSHTNIIFDAVLPYKAKMNDDDFKNKIIKAVKEYDKNLNCVIVVDNEFTNHK